jgi:hypothetical protein
MIDPTGGTPLTAEKKPASAAPSAFRLHRLHNPRHKGSGRPTPRLGSADLVPTSTNIRILDADFEKRQTWNSLALCAASSTQYNLPIRRTQTNGTASNRSFCVSQAA